MDYEKEIAGVITTLIDLFLSMPPEELCELLAKCGYNLQDIENAGQNLSIVHQASMKSIKDFGLKDV